VRKAVEWLSQKALTAYLADKSGAT
jgi:hypothetical protein